jgi:predicted secreted protein
MRKIVLSIIGILLFVVELYGVHLEIVSPKEGEEFSTQIPVELKIDAEPGEVKKLKFYLNNKLLLETDKVQETYILDISQLYYSGEAELSIIVQAQGEMMRVETNILIKNPVLLEAFGGAEDDWANAVIQTQDGGYLIVGKTESFGAGGYDVYVFKLDKNGNKQWEKTFGGEGWDWANAVIQTQDGGYLIVGGTESFGAGGYDVYVFKLDKNGNKQWEKTFGGEGWDWANAVIQTQDGGYLIVGRTYSFGAGGSDAYIIFLDKSGNVKRMK